MKMGGREGELGSVKGLGWAEGEKGALSKGPSRLPTKHKRDGINATNCPAAPIDSSPLSAQGETSQLLNGKEMLD